MLTRSAGRRRRQHTSQVLAASFAQLNLPWLAPAQLRWTSTRAARAPRRDASSRPRDASTSSHSRTQLRSLATAADQHIPRHDSLLPPSGYGSGFRNLDQDKHIPFKFDRGVEFPSRPLLSTHLKPYNDPIIVNTTVEQPGDLIMVQPGLAGTVEELLVHLHTSLSVGRRERAEAIIHRLAERCDPTAPELLYAHNAYLEESLRGMSSHQVGSVQALARMKEMRKWFEEKIMGQGVLPDEKMLVIMIRASIRSLDNSARDKEIRNYAETSRGLGEDAFFSVIHSPEYDGHEFMIVGRITSDLYEEEMALETEAAFDIETTPPGTSTQSREHRPFDPKHVPDVLVTDQKGLGLTSIKKNLDALAQIPALPKDAPADAQRERAYARQQHLEALSVDVALDRWRQTDNELKKAGIDSVMQSRPLGALMWQWYQALLPVLEQELVLVKQGMKKPGRDDMQRKIYGPYLELLPLQKLAACAILFTMSRLTKGKNVTTDDYELELRLGHFTTGLGQALEEEHMIASSVSRRSSKHGTAQRSRSRDVDALRKSSRNTRISAKAKTARRLVQQTITPGLEWPLNIKAKIGALLVSKLVESAQLPVTRDHPRTREKITQMQPAFLHRIKYTRGKKIGLIVPNPALVTKLQSEPLGSLIAKRMPMIVEPVPWESYYKGGYLHTPSPIIRLPLGDKSGRVYFQKADARKDLDTVYKGLTALGSVPWKINHDVFKVQLDAWNSGEAIANFAPSQPTQQLPPEPADADPHARRLWLLEVRELKNKESGLHSQRCFQNFQMEIARTLLNETIYFPHNLDFRGRAYPIPPYLNHMGADNVRALVTFAKGKALGPNGLRWLKIHLATVAGHDKASMEERVEFTMTHLDDIYDSVKNPLEGRRWWLKAEDAWQTLAACFELTSALDSPDPEKFVSHLPVQQDGTCNGLQHYAALGGDKVGAAQVNLEPGDRPADVYTAVAEVVKEEVRKDAEAENPIALKLHGRITRKCVKQPVMTNVYGVTFYGARAQVKKQLEVLFPEVKRTDDVNLEHMSRYIAKKIFESLGVMFTGAQAIQCWLGQCADRISTCLTPEQIEDFVSGAHSQKLKQRATARAKKATAVIAEGSPEHGSGDQKRAALKATDLLFKSSVVWTTPLRLPVVQPYRTTKPITVKTIMSSLSLQDPQVWDAVSKRKQLQAFPPNFIHSLDATHMLLSAVECTARGMTFASIHDSFWTHACDVNELNTVLRDQFVAMHSEDITGRLREEFETRYKGCMYLTRVQANSTLGGKILKLRVDMKEGRLFREIRADGTRTEHTFESELAMEHERYKLMTSPDPAERARGAQMYTPGSILLAEADERAMAAPSELIGQKLGELPADVDDQTADPIGDAEETSTDSDEMAMAMAAEDVALEDADDTCEVAQDLEEDAEHATTAPAGQSKPKRRVGQLQAYSTDVRKKLDVWLPLVFPEVPAKGDFDVTRLRESKYFFH